MRKMKPMTGAAPGEAQSMQEVILRLQSFWSDQGCLIWQPLNSEVGAGTMNPATFLRVLGPEPWSVAYLEPSVRPDDSRYGENPNRLQTHLQFQVVLKPDTGRPQDQYLASLQMLGIDLAANDVRFVEDNWESPALGAWGLGWEVWLNGLEITQYTYFQQAGGIPLDVPAVEITYGLERIVMSLQGVDHFQKIAYAPNVSYGSLVARTERELSTYYLDAADVERFRELFALYEAEARALLQQNLATPAYGYVLRLSHAFNVLDARGAVSVAERAELFGRMRELSAACAQLWLEGVENRDADGTSQAGAGAKESEADEVRSPARGAGRSAGFVLEIGTEELPPSDQDAAASHAEMWLRELLSRHGLGHGSISVKAAPRRVVAVVEQLTTAQEDVDLVVRGPRTDVAFSPDGQPTRAAAGFAARQGVSIDELERVEHDGAWFTQVRRQEPGKRTADILCAELPNLCASLPFRKSMRWKPGGPAFSRPVRWLVALLGSEVLPFEFAGLRAGRSTRGMRHPVTQPVVAVECAEEFLERLAEQGVLVDSARRRELIDDQASELAESVGGRLAAADKGRVMAEVVGLTEDPACLLCSFDPRHLDLPAIVLSTVMVKHQRYFPIEVSEGDLLAKFVAVSDGHHDPDAVRKGNEAVLEARYADARFYFERDQENKLDQHRESLAGVMFHERLGSMLEKADRVNRIADELAARLSLAEEERRVVARAAHLAKADLATLMVTEFTSLAGSMGSQYAKLEGETADVALAIQEHVMPRHNGDDLPEYVPGKVISLADRADSLVGLWSAGVKVSGGSDQFGMRRAALGIVRILATSELDLALGELIEIAADEQDIEVPAAVRDEVKEFALRRFEQLEKDRGIPADVIRSVLPRGTVTPLSTLRALIDEIQIMLEDRRFWDLHQAMLRAERISRGVPVDQEIDATLFEASVERELWAWLSGAQDTLAAVSKMSELVDSLVDLPKLLDNYFDQVLVMADDPRIAQTRQGVLRQVAELPRRLVNLEAIEEREGLQRR